MGQVLGILSVVSDLEESIRFYTDVLEMKEQKRFSCEGKAWDDLFHLPNCKANIAKLSFGHEVVYLAELSPFQGTSYPHDSSSHDLWFQHIAIVVSDMEKAYAKLVKHSVKPISHGYQTIPEWNLSAAGIQAFYFRSPDGHPLELIYFPPGKGDLRWRDSSPLFLGIDHTAIAVSNTKKSVDFYERLGMKVVGRSLNHGETQEKLSGVLGAKVQITTLRFNKGMGIELLEYLHPLNGRVKETHIRAHHMTETQTIVQVEKIPEKPLQIEVFGQIAPLLDPDRHRVLALL